VRRALDWKPFDYFTEDLDPVKSSWTTPPPSRATSEFIARADGTTTLRYRVKLTEPGIVLRLMKPLVRRAFRRIVLGTEHRFNELVDIAEVAVGPSR
jgi:hypothetical protein